jgi:hypothetical protein
MNEKTTVTPQDSSPPSTTPRGDPRASVQGEGDYQAAHRYREQVQEFLKHSDVDERARAAAPDSAKQERELALAEEQGKHRSKGEDPADIGLMYPGRKAVEAEANESPAPQEADPDSTT